MEMSNFEKILEDAGVEMTAENCLRCIELAKIEMREGRFSVESFFKAKEIVMSLCVMPSEAIN